MRYFGTNRRSAEADVDRMLSTGVDRPVCLLTMQGEAIIGLGYIVRSDARTSDAEVAFLVDEEHQGKGIGSLILEHLAYIARDAGVTHFTAEVLPENRGMVGVFKDAGFEVSTGYEDGLIAVVMDIAESEKAVEVMRAREHATEARSIAGLLRPRSVAVLGAGRSPASYGHLALRSLLAAPFNGPVYPLNPSVGHVAGVHAYPRVQDVPGTIDLLLVAVPPGVVEEIMGDVSLAGVKVIVVLSSYREAGPEATERLVEVARQHGIRVLGPECMGVMNTDPEFALNATLLTGLAPSGRVGFFAQSGSLSADVLGQAIQRSIGISTMVSAGDRADISANDLLHYWLADDSTDLVLLYLESFGNPVRFARIARAVSHRKPVIAVQAIAGTERVRSESLFAQAGVIRVDSLVEMLDVTVLLQRMPLPRGDRVAVIDNVSSLGAIAVSTAEHLGMRISGASASLTPTVATEAVIDVVRAALMDPDTDSIVLAFVAHLSEIDEVGPLLEELLIGATKPVVLVTLQNISTRLPTYGAPESAVIALGHATTYALWLQQDPGGTPHLPDVDRQKAQALVDGMLSADELSFTPESAGAFVVAWGVELGDPPEGSVPVVVDVGSDPVFGRAVSFGVAGVPWDLMGDRSWRALPITDADARRMVDEVKAAPMLDGWGGAGSVSRGRLADVVLRLATAAAELPSLERLVVDLACIGDRIVCTRAAGRVDPSARTYDGDRRSLDAAHADGPRSQ